MDAEENNRDGRAEAPGLKPHPLTGQFFPSPVVPGTGWPGDPAGTQTPVARTASDVERLAAAAESLAELDALVSVSRANPRLTEWCERIARREVASMRRASFANEPYWGRPVPSFGDPQAKVLVVGLAPAAHGGNRTGRNFTGDRAADFLVAALYRAGFANQPSSRCAGDGLAYTGLRMAAAVRQAPPANKPTAQEFATDAPWLRREIELMSQLESVVALGGLAWNALWRIFRSFGWGLPAPKVKFAHEAKVDILRGEGAAPLRLVGCYHPSQQNTFTGRLTEPMIGSVFSGLAPHNN